MAKNLPAKPDGEDNKAAEHEDQTGLTALWQDVAGTDQAPSASERHNYYIQTGAVWLAFKDIVRQNEELARYRTNIAFSLSSGAGWDIKQGRTPFYYPPGQDNIHPFDFYVPVDHVIDSLEKADRFSLNIERTVHGDLFDKKSTSDSKALEFIGKCLAKVFNWKPVPEMEELRKRFNPTLSYDEKYLELGKMLVQAVRENKDLIKHKDELDAGNWKRYDPASGKPSPFYLSADEMGASFDFTMRKNKSAPPPPARKLER